MRQMKVFNYGVKKLRPSVWGSTKNFSKQSTKFVPLKGSPPIPTHVDWPNPTAVVWKTWKDNQKQPLEVLETQAFKLSKISAGFGGKLKAMEIYKLKKTETKRAKHEGNSKNLTASYVNVPDRETIPILPGLWMYPGMIPILHSPGLIIPGQLGPISLVFDWLLRAAFTRTYITNLYT